MTRFLGGVLIVALAATVGVLAAPKFTSTWKAPEAAGVSFAGKKVAALIISKDENLRVSGEEALARELSAARPVQAVAAYRLIPREELQDPEKARGWFERAGVEGVVVMRLVSAEKERTYTPAMWNAPYYGTLWGYYGYGWAGVYDPGYVREDTILVIETLVYSVPRNMLLWAGVSETTNPKNAGKVIKDLVGTTVKEMKKQGFIREGSR